TDRILIPDGRWHRNFYRFVPDGTQRYHVPHVRNEGKKPFVIRRVHFVPVARITYRDVRHSNICSLSGNVTGKLHDLLLLAKQVLTDQDEARDKDIFQPKPHRIHKTRENMTDDAVKMC